MTGPGRGSSPGTGTGSGSPGTGDDSPGAGDDSPGGERQVPFFCPYCGEEDLRPADVQPGAWDCASCSRGFWLRFTGVLADGGTS